MKVLFVASGKENGSVSPIIENQGKSLKHAGVNIQYYIINNKGMYGYIKHVYSMRLFLKYNNFDIIHAHYGLTAIVALLAKRQEKLIVSFMGDDIVGSNRISGSVTRISILAASLNIFLSRFFYSYTIVKSEEMRKKISHNKVSLIPNGVNLEIYKPVDRETSCKNCGINPDSHLVIFVSSPLRVEKNYNLVKESVKKTDYRNIILKTLTGHSQEELCYYYNAADVLVLTSFHEGSPNVIKEAMACNCPIVTTKVGDVEWVIGNTNGCYFSSFDPDDFSKNLKKALDFSEKNGRTKGRDRIIEKGLDSESVAKQIIAIYKRVLEKCAGSVE
jgi:teichuronic acid biosynthesis glycosyltransferase TuaC